MGTSPPHGGAVAAILAQADLVNSAGWFNGNDAVVLRRGDVVVSLSTSGNSENMIEALAEARRREMATVALVGYDGGRTAAEDLADHVIVTRSQNIPRIQEAQASAYHVLRELIELVGRGEEPG